MFERLETSRLIVRKPVAEDAEAIFARYASDPEVTPYIGWATHRDVERTRAYLVWSDAEWARWQAGPYLVESKHDGELLGSTGLAFESRHCAATGYVFAKDAWGKGYATEALQAMVDLARRLRLTRLHATCHTANTASCRVLEKGGFTREALLPAHVGFPNLDPEKLYDVFRYVRELRRF